MVFKNGVKNIQAPAYNGAHTVSRTRRKHRNYLYVIQRPLRKNDKGNIAKSTLLPRITRHFCAKNEVTDAHTLIEIKEN